MTTQSVIDELRAHPTQKRAPRTVAAAPWMQVVQAGEPSPAIRAWNLGQGEASVLELARRRQGSVAILDDRYARRCAKAIGLKVMGTLGVIAHAKAVGALEAARPALIAVRDAGLYVSDALFERMLERVGEAP